MTREEKYICLALGLIVYMRHKEVKLNNVFKEQDHPRDEEGRFTDGGGESRSKEGEKYYTTPEEIKEKQSKVKIDFTKDNYLPELNKEDLEELGKKSKPVLVSKRMLDRNRKTHPDVSEEEYNLLLSSSLYNPNYILPANLEKTDYFHFIANIENNKNSGVIVELSENKNNYEVVHIQKLRDRSVKRIIKRDSK